VRELMLANLVLGIVVAVAVILGTILLIILIQRRFTREKETQ
jgi:hypothetical protein